MASAEIIYSYPDALRWIYNYAVTLSQSLSESLLITFLPDKQSGLQLFPIKNNTMKQNIWNLNLKKIVFKY